MFSEAPLPSDISLVDAEMSARRAFNAAIESVKGLSKLAVRRIQAYLNDPVWRAAYELRINGATSFESGLILLGARMIRLGNLTVRTGRFRGYPLEFAEFTDYGLQYLNACASFEGEDCPHREAVFECIGSYLVIDRGNGIVATRSLLEVAVEIDDWELLSRHRSLADDIRSGGIFADMKPPKVIASEEDWEEMFEYCSDWPGERSGFAVVDLSGSKSC
jgi:hypothetical protein